MGQWRWVERARAWDEHVTARLRAEELAQSRVARAAQLAEEGRQRRLLREEAWTARAVARRLLEQLLQATESEELEAMSLRELLPHLPRLTGLLAAGQQLDRRAAEEDRPERDFQETLAHLVTLLHEFVPGERWEELAGRLEALAGEAPEAPAPAGRWASPRIVSWLEVQERGTDTAEAEDEDGADGDDPLPEETRPGAPGKRGGSPRGRPGGDPGVLPR